MNECVYDITAVAAPADGR